MLISVVVPSYNHAPYISQTISSILSQTSAPLELIIVDDGSSDGSRDILKKIDDPRVRINLLEKNVGACAAMNIAVQMTRGDLVAVCNSDDLWEPNKLERQLAVIHRSPQIGAVFTNVSWIDQDGTNVPKDRKVLWNVFTQPNRSRGQWTNKLVLKGNCLCHPSVLIRREAYDRVGYYDNRFRQLPDYDMWLRVLQKYDIFVLDERLVKFRWFANASNASGATSTNARRDVNERALIVRNLIASMDTESWLNSFGSTKPIEDDTDLRIEKTLYLLDSAPNIEGLYRNIGLEWAYELLGTPVSARRLEEKYAFNALTFQKLMGAKCLWLPESVSPQPALRSDASGPPLEAVTDPRAFRTPELIEALKYRFKLSARRLTKRYLGKRSG
ncbi:glycosyltransferase [Hyphomicrobium sp. 2TAF46]|uniref:glycosyltransferase n=1 Tax=Hyphomicrobium sp. 2TAF46 TaxID=3233019 RepID=UPI003F8E7576